MRRFYILLSAAVIAGCGRQEVTMGTLLDEMISMRSVTEHPGDAYRLLQQSSYDRRSVWPDDDGWFANDDGFGFIRLETNEGRTEKVLFEDEGPGAIVRIWLTTQNPAGTFRFYFDGSDTAGWVIPAYDLMQFGIAKLGRGLLQPHTSYEPGVKGGSTLWLPITYARGCRVTFEEPEWMGRVPHYYQFNYRKYAPGTKVETMSIATVEKYARKIVRTDAALLSPAPAKGRKSGGSGNIGENESVVIDLPRGSRVVDEVVFEVSGFSAENYERLMRGLIFIAEFDGQSTVWAPLADFSGAGMGAPEIESRFLSSDGSGRVVCRWPMPYRNTARLTLLNASPIACGASIAATTSDYRWNDRSLYFHTSWKQECGLSFVREWNDCRDWNFITIEGRGVYLGDVLSLFNHARAWYGEGDEKIWVDDDTFPSHFGTGVEDYYNSSWAPVIPFHTPFGGAPRADLPNSQGYNTFTRTRGLDAIPFGRSLRFDMEMLGWVDGKVDYAVTSYWYGDPGAIVTKTSGIGEALRAMPVPPPDPAKFKVHSAIEFESVKFSLKSKGLNADVQNMAGFPDGQWSGAGQFTGFGGVPGDHVEFVFNNMTDRPYSMKIYATKAADYGQVAFLVDGHKKAVLDGYGDRVTDSGPIDLGTVVPHGGRITLRIEITGKNALSTGYMFGLDCLTLTAE